MPQSAINQKKGPNQDNERLATLAREHVKLLRSSNSAASEHVERSILNIARTAPAHAVALVHKMARELWSQCHAERPFDKTAASRDLDLRLSPTFPKRFAEAALRHTHSENLREQQQASVTPAHTSELKFPSTSEAQRNRVRPPTPKEALAEAKTFLVRHRHWAMGEFPTEGALQTFFERARRLPPCNSGDPGIDRLHRNLLNLPQDPSLSQLREAFRPVGSVEALSEAWLQGVVTDALSQMLSAIGDRHPIPLEDRVLETYGPKLELEMVRKERILSGLAEQLLPEHERKSSPALFKAPFTTSAIELPVSCKHAGIHLSEKAVFAVTHKEVYVAARHNDPNVPLDWKLADRHHPLLEWSARKDCIVTISRDPNNIEERRICVVGRHGSSRSYTLKEGQDWHTIKGPNGSLSVIACWTDGHRTPIAYVDPGGEVRKPLPWEESAEIHGEHRFIGWKTRLRGLLPYHFAVSDTNGKIEATVSADSYDASVKDRVVVMQGEKLLEYRPALESPGRFEEIARYRNQSSTSIITLRSTHLTITVPCEIKELKPLVMNDNASVFLAFGTPGSRFIVSYFNNGSVPVTAVHALDSREATPSAAMGTASGVLFTNLSRTLNRDGTWTNFPATWESLHGGKLFICKHDNRVFAVCQPNHDPVSFPRADGMKYPVSEVVTAVSTDGRSVYVASVYGHSMPKPTTLFRVVENGTVKEFTARDFGCRTITPTPTSVLISGSRHGFTAFYDQDFVPLPVASAISANCSSGVGAAARLENLEWVSITASKTPQAERQGDLLSQIVERVRNPRLLSDCSPELAQWLAGTPTETPIIRIAGAKEHTDTSLFLASQNARITAKLAERLRTPLKENKAPIPPQEDKKSLLWKSLEKAASLPLAPFVGGAKLAWRALTSLKRKTAPHPYEPESPLPTGSANPGYGVGLAWVPRFIVRGSGVQPTLMIENVTAVNEHGNWESARVPTATSRNNSAAKSVTIHRLNGRGGWHDVAIPAGGSLEAVGSSIGLFGARGSTPVIRDELNENHVEARPYSITSYRVQWPVGPHELSLPESQEGLEVTRQIASQALDVKIEPIPTDGFPRPLLTFLSSIEKLSPIEQVKAVVAFADKHVAYRWFDSDGKAAERPYMDMATYLHSMQVGGEESTSFHGVCTERGVFIASLLQSLGHPVCVGRGHQGGPGPVTQVRHAAACYASVSADGEVSLVPLEPRSEHFARTISPKIFTVSPSTRESLKQLRNEPQPTHQPELPNTSDSLAVSAFQSKRERAADKTSTFTSDDAKLIDHLLSHALFAPLTTESGDHQDGRVRLQLLLADPTLAHEHLKDIALTTPTKPVERYHNAPPEAADGYAFVHWLKDEHATFAALSPDQRVHILQLLAAVARSGLSDGATTAVALLQEDPDDDQW